MILWDGFTGEIIHTLVTAFPQWERDELAFSPDGQWLAFIGDSVWVYRVDDLIMFDQPVPIANFALITRWVYQLMFTPDSQRLLAVGEDVPSGHYLTAWDLTTQTLLYRTGFNRGVSAHHVVLSADGRYAITVTDGSSTSDLLNIFRLTDGVLIRQEVGRSLAFSPDSQRVVINLADGVRVMRLADQTILTDHPNALYGVYHPDGTLMLVDDRDQLRWLKGNQNLLTVDLFYPVERIGFSPDGRHWWSVHRLPTQGTQVAIWHDQRLITTHDLVHPWGHQQVVFDPLGRSVAIGDHIRGRVDIWDLTDQRARVWFTDVFDPGWLIGVDQDRLITSNEAETYFWQLTPTGLHFMQRLPLTTVALVSGGSLITVVDHWIGQSSPDGQTVIRRIAPADHCYDHVGRISEVAVTARYFACLAADGQVRVWDLDTGERMIETYGQSFALKGDQLLFVQPNAMEIWHLPTRSRIRHERIFTSHRSALHWDQGQWLVINTDDQILSLLEDRVVFNLPRYVVGMITIEDCKSFYADPDCVRRRLPYQQWRYYDDWQHTFSPSGAIWVGFGRGGDGDYQIAIWDINDRRQITALTRNRTALGTPVFNHAETLLIQPYRDVSLWGPVLNRTADIVDLTTGMQLGVIKGGKASFDQIAFTADDRLLLTYSDSLRVWGVLAD
ncbi:MAG: WD40 repeat domain-containing protein [Anaerolineae bacterium]|nr:WD40 repeat domain-containing protein [Anaerolineae bacterium]